MTLGKLLLNCFLGFLKYKSMSIMPTQDLCEDYTVSLAQCLQLGHQSLIVLFLEQFYFCALKAYFYISYT